LWDDSVALFFLTIELLGLWSWLWEGPPAYVPGIAGRKILLSAWALYPLLPALLTVRL
jgi:hypothetical protein